MISNKSRIAESKIILARTQAKPLPEFSVGLRRYESTDDFGLVTGVSMPFGKKNSQQGTIQALSSSLLTHQAEANVLEKSLLKQAYRLNQEINHSAHVISTLIGESIPILKQALKEAKKAYQLGRYSYRELSAIQNELIATEEKLITAYFNLHSNNIEIERLTGGTL
ncbi:MAG: TolC family protein [Methylococcales bacterium]|nr:TolC family protein [Methylococcales bacterium]